MKMSLPGLARNLRAMCDELHDSAAFESPEHDDWLMHHQPRLHAFLVEEVLRNLQLVADDPSRLQEFLDFVEVQATPKPCDDCPRGESGGAA